MTRAVPTAGTRSTAGRRRLAPAFGLVAVAALVVGVLIGSASEDPDPSVAASISDVESEGPSSTATPAPTTAATETVVEEEEPEPRPHTRMPTLVGATLVQARQVLRQSGLRVGTITTRVSAQPPGTVLRQSETARDRLLEGAFVRLVVSAPWPRLPMLAGMRAPAAIDRLHALGFRTQVERRTVTSGPDDTVLELSPRGGGTQPPHSLITLVVSDLQVPVAPVPLASSCTPGYQPCLPPKSDYDCAGGSGDGPGYAQGPVYVTGSDPYALDSDGDGVACES